MFHAFKTFSYFGPSLSLDRGACPTPWSPMASIDVCCRSFVVPCAPSFSASCAAELSCSLSLHVVSRDPCTPCVALLLPRRCSRRHPHRTGTAHPLRLCGRSTAGSAPPVASSDFSHVSSSLLTSQELRILSEIILWYWNFVEDETIANRFTGNGPNFPLHLPCRAVSAVLGLEFGSTSGRSRQASN
jgi:hypothetical protein